MIWIILSQIVLLPLVYFIARYAVREELKEIEREKLRDLGYSDQDILEMEAEEYLEKK